MSQSSQQMMEVWTSQSNFAVGEITPLLQARIDIDQYYKGLKKAKNVIQLPQGPIRRRFGLDYVAQITGITDFTQIRLANFEYSSAEQYVLVFKPLAILIYENDTLVATVTTVYTSSQIIKLRFDQNLNQMIIVHPDVPPYQLVRGANSSSWTISLYTFKNVPSFDFNNNYSGITFVLGATSGQNITLTASAPIFSADFVGGTFTSIPGLAKIIAYNSTTVVHVNIYVAFSSTTVNGYEAILAEPAFSATRGWPQSIAFYQSRLFFGGTKSLPQGLFGSVLNEYDSFLTGLGLSTDALILFLAGARLNSIEYLLNAVSLFVFTTGGVYATQPLTTQALTPSTAAISKQTSTGVQINVAPLFIDNSVMYVQKGGRDAMRMTYSIEISSYKTVSSAITAEHLIKNPVDVAKFEHAQQNQGTYSFYCNGTAIDELTPSGTLAIYQIIEEQNIKAWTWAQTDGKFRRSVGLDDAVYFIVERDINGSTVLYLEKMSFDSLMDCQSSFTAGSPTNVITGLSYLEGKTAGVISEGNYLGEYEVLAGTITLDEEITEAEIGLVWFPEVMTLPINVQTQQGNNIYQKKQVRQTYLHVYQSQGVLINDILIPGINVGTQILGEAPPLLDGAYQIPTSFGNEWNQPFVFSQNVPGPFTLLGLSYQTEIS